MGALLGYGDPRREQVKFFSLKGTQLVAGGNAPRKLSTSSDPERVARCHSKYYLPGSFGSSPRCDPFRVETQLHITGAVAPGY